MKKNSSSIFVAGFTLVEILVVLLIIAGLVAIALPQYQTAVDESRYTALMPMAKSVANAQEAYYMSASHYSPDLAYLDIQLPNNPSGTTADLGDGVTIEISEDPAYGYVKISKDILNNNYIIYQRVSVNFPGEIHCEALSGDDRAKRLCESLDGQKINGSLTSGYDTYVLEGTGTGIPWSMAYANNGPAGWQSCDSYPCTKACSRSVASGYSCEGTYNENHTYSEKVCQGNICTVINYSDEGKALTRSTCSMEGTVCNVKTTQTYDTSGNKLAERTCSANNADGSCSAYSAGTNYTYDGNNRLESVNTCKTVSAAGTCTAFSETTDYFYDNHNNVESKRTCTSSINASTGECSKYDSRTNYTYDEDGLRTERTCTSLNSAGACSGGYKDSYDYTYPSDDVSTRRKCSGVNNSTGQCNGYSGGAYNYTYNEAGDVVSQRTCGSANSSTGVCTGSYNTNDSYDYVYDTETNQTTVKKCASFNSGTSVCKTYNTVTVYTYDDAGHVIAEHTCSSGNVNTSAGTCKKYNSGTEYSYDEQGNQTAQRTCTSWTGTTSCNSWGDYTYN